MARSMALNPSSLPFFPSGMGPNGAEQTGVGAGLGLKLPTSDRDREPSGTSTATFSTSDFRSVSSSPVGSVPTTDSGDGPARTNSGSNSPGSSALVQRAEEKDKSSPDVSRSIQPLHDGGPIIAHSSGTFDGEETPGPRAIHHWVMKAQAPANQGNDSMELMSATHETQQDHHFSQPILPGPNRSLTSSTSQSYHTSFKPASSPASSIGSASINTSSVDFSSSSFEVQIKSSPTIRDLLERLARCEFSNREIQRELAEVHTKVNFLVERSLGSWASEPEFKNPFTSNTVSRSITPSLGLGPLQTAVPSVGTTAKTDEITQLSNRINSLTTSVGQLLALQTQQHMSSLQQTFGQSGGISSLQKNADIAPNQVIAPHMGGNQGMLGHGLPNRPDLRPSPRVPNPPMRTWSAGTLELPIRSADMNIGRPDNIHRDKRKSIASLMRRDSAGALDSPNDQWFGQGGSPRDQGPVATKWEHLPLAQDLLRSLNKFGVGPPNKIQQRALPFLLRGADIIAQAPPTQERIAAYVIPAIHVAVTHMSQTLVNRGPLVVLISTTVDQATQAQRIIRDLGGAIGVKSALGVGSLGPNNDVSQELRLLQQSMPHIICGTPQKLHALFTAPGGLSGAEVRFLVLDEVDQLIARNLHEFVFNIVKLLPPPRSRAINSAPGLAPGTSQTQLSPLDSPFSPNTGRRVSAVGVIGLNGSITPNSTTGNTSHIERQTALFSNTVPQDVLNLANAIQLREPVRVLVRRDGNVTHSETSQGTKGLRQFYLYLAFTASGARSDPSTMNAGGGHGIIGSGRGTGSSAEVNQAREWKLDALADLLDDVEVPQIIIHVGGLTALDSVVYKLASKGLEAIPLHSDMNAGAKLAALNKFRNQGGTMLRRPVTKVLVVYDVQVKAPDVFQVPLVINYDLPQAVEEYAHRVAPAIANNYSRAGVVVNFVTATGGDVEMLRSIECFYKIKCPEVPLSLRDLF